MSIRILDPTSLGIKGTSTVVPQSIDNQFMSDTLFRRVQKKKFSLQRLLDGSLAQRSDPIAELFLHGHKVEYIRSLLYSRRLIINRNAFWNNPVIIASVLGSDRDALVTLLAQGTIVPYLWDEESFDQEPNFDVLGKGKEAIMALVNDSALADIVCVRLGGANPVRNRVENNRLVTRFRQQLQLPLEMDQERLALVVDGLLGDRHATASDRSRLARELRDVATWVRRKQPTRNDLYKKYITHGNPTQSQYRVLPFTFELKKWFDIVYNSNLPASLQARTFTPHGMPTPVDVEIDWAHLGDPLGFGDIEGDFIAAGAQIVDRARGFAELRAWAALEQELAIPLPSPEELSHLDVIEIRAWDTWRTMMSTMERHLDEPLDPERMREFWGVYNDFLREMSTWWLKKKGPDRERFAAGVARIWRFGSWFVGLVQLGAELFPVLPSPNVRQPPWSEGEEFVQITVETGLYLYQKAGVEWRRSQAVRGMQKVQRVRRSEVWEIYSAVRLLYPDLRNELVPGLTGTDTAVEEECG